MFPSLKIKCSQDSRFDGPAGLTQQGKSYRCWEYYVMQGRHHTLKALIVPPSGLQQPWCICNLVQAPTVLHGITLHMTNSQYAERL